MGDADEGIVLTDQERETLAGLAAAIGDPWLAGQLAGGGSQTPLRPKRPPVWLRFVASGWAGLVLLLVGAALAVTTFVHSAVLASLGLVLMGVGLWRFVDEHGDGVMRRLKGRRNPAVAAPSPRTRP